MRINIRTGFFDSQKFHLDFDENALIMRNADNQIILPFSELMQVIMRMQKDGRVAVSFASTTQKWVGSVEDIQTAQAIAHALAGHDIDCLFDTKAP